MNDIPINWAVQLQEAYPKRSGPCGWGGMRLLLACRRALMESTWEQIIDGCKRYKDYSVASGKEGTDFIQAPLRFIQEACYLEEFQYQAPEDPKKIEARQKVEERWAKAHLLASRLDPILEPMQHESVEAFETRIMLNQRDLAIGARESTDTGKLRINSHIASLADRMRIAK